MADDTQMTHAAALTPKQIERCVYSLRRGLDLLESDKPADSYLPTLARYAEVALWSRRHTGRPHDPPEVLATLGFYPDCGCCECYAIHCLAQALDEITRLRESVASTERRSNEPNGVDQGER